MKKHISDKNLNSIREWSRKIILIAAIIVFLFSAYKLYSIFTEYREAKEGYEKLEEQVVIVDSSEEEDDKIQEELKEKTSEYVKTIDFDKLLEMNKETVGWIRFETLPIRYPIMQGSDNDYYLHHTFEGVENSSASIFIDYQNNSKFEDKNTFIYGHNMKNDSMFGRLNDYSKQDFYEENQYFWIYTPTANYRYQIFSCYVVRADGDSYKMDYADEKDYQEYLTIIQNYSKYDTGIEVDTKDSIVTLSTCTSNPDNRFLVHAVRVETYKAE